MFKSIGRIGKDKTIFDVTVKPINIRIHTNSMFNMKLQVRRGKQSPEETKQFRVDRSLKNSDIKTITFTESYTFPCTYFIKDGTPEEKTCTFTVIKLLPAGKEVEIAETEVNFSDHFGDLFSEGTVQM